MKKINTKFQVELTTEEISILTNALNDRYVDIKAMLGKNNISTSYAKQLEEEKVVVKNLRNGFANLIGRCYMGREV